MGRTVRTVAPLIATKSSTGAMIVDARSVTIVGRDAGPRIKRATTATHPDPVKRFHHKRLPSQPPVKDHPCVECGAERKACDDWHSIHGGPEGICGGCWNTHYHYWRSRYDTVTPRHVVVDSVARELKSKFPKTPQLTDDEVNSLLAEYGF